MSDDFKKIMTAGGSTEIKSDIDPAIETKLNEIKNELLSVIEELKAEYPENKIPFKAIKENVNYKYQVISDVILYLIMEKKLLGFINDGGTEAYDDDILILREKRLVDELEPEYRTGYAE